MDGKCCLPGGRGCCLGIAGTGGNSTGPNSSMTVEGRFQGLFVVIVGEFWAREGDWVSWSVEFLAIWVVLVGVVGCIVVARDDRDEPWCVVEGVCCGCDDGFVPDGVWFVTVVFVVCVVCVFVIVIFGTAVFVGVVFVWVGVFDDCAVLVFVVDWRALTCGGVDSVLLGVFESRFSKLSEPLYAPRDSSEYDCVSARSDQLVVSSSSTDWVLKI